MILLPTLVLASASPRRRQLLAEHGYRAEVCPTSVEESSAAWLSTRELVLLNARRKAATAARSRPGALVLGADTLVCLNGRVFGKPHDLAEAQEMLKELSGQEHSVFTGVCLIMTETNTPRAITFTEQTRVTFRSLNELEIKHYHTLINPLDKAGGYAAQEYPELIIASVTGSWSNVLGLPMETLSNALAQFNILPQPRFK